MDKRWLLAGLGVIAVGLAGLLLWVVSGTSLAPEAGSDPDTVSGSPTPDFSAIATPHATPGPTPPSRVARADPTCENIMRPGFASEQTTHPIPAEDPEPMPLFAEGISCWWSADPTVGTDNVLAYSWTAADAETWAAFTREQLGLADSPFFLEDGDRGEYLTEKTDYWIRDDEDYGSTFLFTGDVIIWAMTKAATADVVGPPAS